MSAAVLVRLSAGCVALALASALPLPGSLGRAHTQGRERVAYVSVVDSERQQPVQNVTADALVIREDGVQREVLRVAPATSPMPIAMILDNSEAATQTIADLRQGVSAFLRAAAGVGPIAIFTVADRPTMMQSYTDDQSALTAAADRLFAQPGSGATLLDTIRDVANGLTRRDEADRAAIVVVTGENVEYSNLHYRTVLESLDASGAVLHALVLLNPRASLLNEEARNRATVLDRGPRESGGARFDVLTSMGFEERMQTLGAILKAQHRVTYARPESLIPPEKFEVSAVKPGLVAYGAPARGQEKK